MRAVAGFLSLLEENDPDLQLFALNNLDSVVDEFWAEISDKVRPAAPNFRAPAQ